MEKARLYTNNYVEAYFMKKVALSFGWVTSVLGVESEVIAKISFKGIGKALFFILSPVSARLNGFELFLAVINLF